MRSNGPTTGRAVEFTDQALLVSRTDPRGVITYANDAFVETSGFSRQELLGSPHNLVRHPDMPPAAFADLWATVADGQPWVGLVKNRCKNGDHYWVQATVTPQYEGGRIAGYMSVRIKPTAAAIAAAESLYARFRAGERGLVLRQGRVCAGGCVLREHLGSLRGRVVALAGLLLGLMALAIGLGFVLLQETGRQFSTLFDDRLVVMGQLGRMQANHRGIWGQFGEATADVRTPEEARSRFAAAEAAIATDLSAYLATYLTAEEEVLAKRLTEQMEQVKAEIYRPAREALAGDATTASLKLGRILGASHILHINEQLNEVLGELMRLQETVATGIMVEAAQHRRMANLAWTILGAVGILCCLLMTWNLTRRLKVRIGALEGTLRQLAGGERRLAIDLDGTDELAPLFRATAGLQTNLVYAASATAETRQGLLKAFDASVGGVLASQDEAVNGLRATAENQGTGAQALTASVQTVAASASELNASIKEIASQASHVSNLTRSAADTGQANRSTMDNLSKATAEITAVAGLIADIAGQTNLLALNATIEAARAGDAGRGFAVVASEVKSLANQTQQATGDIAKKIAAVQRDAEAAVNALATMGEAVTKANDAAQAIAAAVEEQSAVVDEVARSAEQASTGAASASEAAGQVAESARTMAASQLTLNEAVRTFKAGSAA